MLICIIISIFIAAVISVLLVKQKKKYAKRIRQVNEQLASLVQKLNQANEEKVTSITRREELLSMLIVLKQDNRQIAELMAIAPRSVLILRHCFRQKIGMNTEHSLENFIEELLI